MERRWRAQWKVMNLVADVGSQLGLWLGMSIISIIEFFFLIIVLIIYFFIW